MKMTKKERTELIEKLASAMADAALDVLSNELNEETALDSENLDDAYDIAQEASAKAAKKIACEE